MRPHKLTFGGIGAYAGKVEIDFDDLSRQGLYLIVGQTGSGKTTIFDAMTFSLYGKTASEREAMFVSDHEGRVDPFVEFTFSHQGRRFVVHREPAKDRSKNAVPSKQWFREVDASGKEVRTETGSTKVSAAVHDLLGLDADQFMKVVLLPQGKFQEFLMAKSTERRPLLQKIFGTGLYAIVAMRLKMAAEELEQAAESARIALESEHGTARSVVDSLDDDVRTDLPDPDQDLSGVIERLGTIHAERKKVADEAGAKHAQAVSAVTSAETDLARFAAQEELQQLESIQKDEEKGAAGAEDAIAAHERADRVISAATAFDAACTAAVGAREAVKTCRANLARLVKGLSIEPATIDALVSAVPTASPNGIAQELNSLQNKVNEVLKAEADLEAARTELKNAESEICRIEKEIKRLDVEQAKGKMSLETAKKKLKESDDAAKKVPSLEARIEKIDELHEIADVEGAQADLVAAQGKLDAATLKFNAAESKVDEARRSRTLHLAGELAATLAKGEECPVCGSVDHPKKAKKTSDVDIAKLEKSRDSAQGQLTEARAVVDSCQDAVKAAKSNKAKLPTAAEEEKLRKDFEKTCELAEFSDVRSEEVEACEENLETLKTAMKNLAIELSKNSTLRDQASKTITSLEPKAQALGSVAAVKKAKGVLEEASDLVDSLGKAVESETTTVANEATTKTNLETVLARESFTTVDAARTAVLEPERIAELRKLIQDVADRAGRISTLKGVVGSGPVPTSKPDLQALIEARDLLKEQSEFAAASATKVSAAIEQLVSAKKKIDELGPEVESKIAEANKALALAKVINTGAGAGNDRQLGLEEWVQRTLFEEVCEVATDQLLKLSSNRYVLTLDAEDARARRRAGGLELYVIDSQNGKRRSVHTLSGGEQFLTSLALALALAEVVERHAGGMELSALFIDEGFGSLDGETLDAAIDVLLKLHDTGRTVGVITHVEAMQQQLPIGIRITKSNKGSSLEVLASA